MASTALYNRWRSRTFAKPDDRPLIGQEHITRTLRNAVASGQISHAYLFCGPRGTGKTSAARILARAVNCKRGMQGEPCNECENCEALLSGRQIDLLVEIDAASNRGVEDARQLRERLQHRPGGEGLTGRYKVYIIDEVHMLTSDAFNTLLKSLEEPPPHVIFILATTDPQKVLPTVVSRCQRFDFKPIPLETLTRHLAHIAQDERVEIEPAGLELLARTAAGGARDAVSLLDQALAYAGASLDGAPVRPDGKLTVTAAQIQAMLGLTDFDAVCRLVDAMIARDVAGGLRLVGEVTSRGGDLRQFARQVLDFLRAALLHASDAGELANLDEETRDAVRQRGQRLGLAGAVRLIRLFTQAEQGLRAPSAQPQLPLELAVVEAALETGSAAVAPAAGASEQRAAGSSRATAVAPPAAAPAIAAVADRPVAVEQASARPAPTAPAPVELEEPAEDAPLSEETFPAPAPSRQATARQAPERRAPEPRAPVADDAVSDGSEVREAGAAAAPPLADGESVSLELVRERWPSVLESLRRSQKSLEALLKAAEATAVEDGNVVVLSFPFAFHAGKVQEPANLVAVNRAVSRTLGARVTVRCEVAAGVSTKVERQRGPAATDDPVVSKAMRVLNARVMTPDELVALEAMPVVTELEASDL